MLRDKLRVARHLGDNPHSDGRMPAQHAIEGARTIASEPNAVEKRLIAAGLRPVATLMREARLVTWHEESLLRQLQLIQVCLNLPIIILSSIRLITAIKAMGAERVLFCSRDCNLWIMLFRELQKRFKLDLSVDYFLTNRRVRTDPSPEYLAYAKRLIAPRTLIVDVCGTGWSLSLLLSKLGRKDAELFFIHDMSGHAIRQQYEKLIPTSDRFPIHHVVRDEPPTFSSEPLEMCNYDDLPPLNGMLEMNGSFVPEFETDKRPPDMKRAVRVQREAFLTAVSLMKHHDIASLLEVPNELLSSSVTWLYQSLAAHGLLNAIFGPFHMAEDAVDRAALRASR
jgi:hypothetical protein